MRIGTGYLSTLRHLNNTQKAMNRVFNHLASGRAVSSAQEGPATLAIFERINSQIRGLSQNVRNMNDAHAVLATADSAIGSQIDLLQRMREIAIQSANGTLDASDRANLDQEFQSLLLEFNRITEETEFNGQKLLDGTFSTLTIQAGPNASQTISASIEGTRQDDILDTTVTEEVVVGSGTFGAENSVALGNGTPAENSEFGDFNNDGFEDIVSTKLANNVICVLLGDGTGSFSNLQTLAVGNNTNSSSDTGLAVADLNHDGYDDISVASFGTNNITIWFGSSTGTFTTATTIAATGAFAIQAADVDGDNHLDLLASNVLGASIHVLLGDGAGGFSAGTSITGLAGIRNFEVGDIDNDGDQDVISGTTANNLAVRINNGSGSFSAGAAISVTSAAITHFDLGYFDGDSNLDLAVNGSVFSIFSGNGSGAFSLAQTWTVGNVLDVDTADLNGDGFDDLVYSNTSTKDYSVYLSNGDTTFTQSQTISLTNDAYTVAIGQINSSTDSIYDLLFGTGTPNWDFEYVLGIAAEGSESEEVELSVDTQAHAQNILSVIDSGIDELLSRRAALGVQMNRLESATNWAFITQENMSASKSLLIDADISSEVSELVRLQIMQQSITGALVQQNLSAQLILQLLKFD